MSIAIEWLFYGLDYFSAVPRLLSGLPYGSVSRFATRSTEETFMRDLQDGEIAYLWPSVSLRAHEIVHERGNPIVLEGINTRMASARLRSPLRHTADVGLAPLHGITDERVAEEENKFRLARGIFAPSPGVEAALQDACLLPWGIVDLSNKLRRTAQRPAAVDLGSLSEIGVSFRWFGVHTQGCPPTSPSLVGGED